MTIYVTEVIVYDPMPATRKSFFACNTAAKALAYGKQSLTTAVTFENADGARANLRRYVEGHLKLWDDVDIYAINDSDTVFAHIKITALDVA